MKRASLTHFELTRRKDEDVTKDEERQAKPLTTGVARDINEPVSQKPLQRRLLPWQEA
jgi:hypothetical protein